VLLQGNILRFNSILQDSYLGEIEDERAKLNHNTVILYGGKYFQEALILLYSATYSGASPPPVVHIAIHCITEFPGRQPCIDNSTESWAGGYLVLSSLCNN
jgi:hypothetical protein